MQLFRELHGSGRTIVMITHDPAVSAVAQRRITLCDGCIASDARTEASCSPS